MGRTYQKSRSFLGLSVEDNLYLAVLGVRSGPSSARSSCASATDELRERARELAATVGLDGREQTLVGSLSHGEQRQLEVAMARASNPRLMMLDEPASGLSRGERVALTDLLLQLDRDDHADPDRARHGRRASRRRAGDDDARRPVIVEGTPDEIRANQTVHDLYLGRGYSARWLSRCSRSRASNAYYGRAQALEDVSFEIAGGSTSIVGRNGMGKTTLCNAIVGIPPARVTGSIRYQGRELVGALVQDREARHRLRAAGPPAVPVALGRRAPADDRVRAAARRRWTVERVYELFPRLARAQRNGGAQLSGGEQQMLAIGRALLTNPTLLIMDEPSEGLAPAIIEQLIETFKHARARKGSRSC